jgi:hypothetical protein
MGGCTSCPHSCCFRWAARLGGGDRDRDERSVFLALPWFSALTSDVSFVPLALTLLANLRIMEDDELVGSSSVDQPAWTLTIVKFIEASSKLLPSSVSDIKGDKAEPLSRFFSREVDLARS